jgi:drug/metabolite transporter (DMT)-like permease
MSWQLLLAIHLLFSSTFALVYRRMAANLNGYGRIVTSVIYLCFQAPAGIIIGLSQRDQAFSFPLETWLLLGLGALFFAAANFWAYRANEQLDAAQFAIITNLEALFVIVLAGTFLGERLSLLQFLGALLLIVAAIDVAVEKTGRRTFRVSQASWIALGACLFVAAGLTTEKALLQEMSFATYVLLAWGAQTLAVGLFTLRDRNKIKQVTRKQFSEMLVLGCLRLGAALSGVAVITRVDISIVASVRSYKPILIFIGALIFLSEKRDFKRRLIGAGLATLGLLLLIN